MHRTLSAECDAADTTEYLPALLCLLSTFANVIAYVAVLDTSMTTLTRYVWPTAANADYAKVWLLQITLQVN